MDPQKISKLHTHLDHFAKEWSDRYIQQGRSIHCRKGCSGCCHLAVHATFPEAIPVAVNLSVEGRHKLENYIDRITGVRPELRTLKNYLKRHRQELGPCPFLGKTEECTIYSLRPFSCRALLSTRPAAWCTVDFSALTEWDKRAYESSLDRHIVTWPTHFVAATQDFGQEAEKNLLEAMRRELGWSLSGNFAVMVWLEHSLQLSTTVTAVDQLQQKLQACGLDHRFLLDFSTTPAEAPTTIHTRGDHV